MGFVYNATAFRTRTAISRLSKIPGRQPESKVGVWHRVEADLVISYHGWNDIHADVVHIAARRDSLAHLKVAAS